MRYALLFQCVLSFSILACTAQNKELKDNTTIQKNQQNSTMKGVDFIIQSRGKSILYQIDSSQVIYTINGNAETQRTQQDWWQKLQKSVEKLSLEKINTYPAPSDNRFSDKTASAQIKIKTNLNVYSSVTFDEGIPPKELEDLYFLLNKINTSSNKLPVKKPLPRR
jgi:hypothetical protein